MLGIFEAYVNFRIPFGKRWFLHFTEKETEAEGWRACPTVTGRVTRPAGIRILEFCLPASCWAHWARNSHTSAVTRSVNIQCFQDSAKKISFFMKMNSVHPNLICLPCFPWSSLFVLSFTFSFHFLYAPESFLFLIHFPFFLLFPHAVRELCLFIPHNISFFVSHFPWVSQTCPQNCSVVQGHSCCSQTVFHSTLIF